MVIFFICFFSFFYIKKGKCNMKVLHTIIYNAIDTFKDSTIWALKIKNENVILFVQYISPNNLETTTQEAFSFFDTIPGHFFVEIAFYLNSGLNSIIIFFF